MKRSGRRKQKDINEIIQFSKIDFPELRRFKKMHKKDPFYFKEVIDLSMDKAAKDCPGQGSFYVLLLDRFVYYDSLNYYIESNELLEFFLTTEIKISIDEIKKMIRKNITTKKNILSLNCESFIGIIHSKKYDKSLFFDFEIFQGLIIDDPSKESAHLTISDGKDFNHVMFTEKAIFDINNKNLVEIKTVGDPLLNIVITDELRAEGLKRIKNKGSDDRIDYVVECYKLVLNLLLYMSAFPENISDKAPFELCNKNNINNSKTISISKTISDYLIENKEVSPHLRRGHFRYLDSEFYKNKRGQIIFVKSSFVKGNAKTIIENEIVI